MDFQYKKCTMRHVKTGGEIKFLLLFLVQTLLLASSVHAEMNQNKINQINRGRAAIAATQADGTLAGPVINFCSNLAKVNGSAVIVVKVEDGPTSGDVVYVEFRSNVICRYTDWSNDVSVNPVLGNYNRHSYPECFRLTGRQSATPLTCTNEKNIKLGPTRESSVDNLY